MKAGVAIKPSGDRGMLMGGVIVGDDVDGEIARGLFIDGFEKSQCQALERTQPGLPLGIGHIRTKTHDSWVNGPVALFAAHNYLGGKLIPRRGAPPRHQEWLAFLAA